MAYITKNKLISDIELQLNQGTISDDSQLDRLQIAQWIDYELAQLTALDCNDALRKGKQVPPIYITRQSACSLTKETIIYEVANYAALPFPGIVGFIYYTKAENKYYKWATGWVQISKYEVEKAEINQRFYFLLFNDVIDLQDDSGVLRVLTDEYNEIKKSSIQSIDMVRNLRFSGPSSETLIWYRAADRIYIEGLNASELYDNSFIVDYVSKQDVLTLIDESEIRISDALLPVLIDKVVQRGKLQMYGTLPDVGNDGVDVKQQMYHTAISNPTKDENIQQQ